MGLTSFILRSIGLSGAVALRMLPVLLVSLAALAMLYQFMSSSPVGFFVILAAFYLPLLVFLFVCAVRAGLMAMRVTQPFDLKRMATYTVRVMRLNFMLNNVIVGVLGFGTAVIAVLILQPNLVTELREGTEIESFGDLQAIFELIGQFPLFVLPIIGLAACVSIGANGSSIAASSAAAAARGPNHDLLFGIARKFGHLFALGLVLIVLPLIALQFVAGGLGATLQDAFSLGWGFVIGACIYLGWVICAVASGMTYAYILTLSDDDLEKIEEQNALMGLKHPPEDIRALRQARQDIIDGHKDEMLAQAAPEEPDAPAANAEPEIEATAEPEADKSSPPRNQQ